VPQEGIPADRRVSRRRGQGALQKDNTLPGSPVPTRAGNFQFVRDRRRWLQWLFEGKKRFGTCILNYAVTSNHIHLLVRDGQEREVIPQTIQLIAGGTGPGAAAEMDGEYCCWE